MLTGIQPTESVYQWAFCYLLMFQYARFCKTALKQLYNLYNDWQLQATYQKQILHEAQKTLKLLHEAFGNHSFGQT